MGTKSARHHHKSSRIFGEHDLAYKEVVEVEVGIAVNIRIGMLLKGQLDIEPLPIYRRPAGRLYWPLP